MKPNLEYDPKTESLVLRACRKDLTSRDGFSWKNKIEHTQPSDSPLKVGQFYYHEDGETYLLANVSGASFALICLDNGVRWTAPTSEIGSVFGSSSHRFTLITSPFTVTPQP